MGDGGFRLDQGCIIRLQTDELIALFHMKMEQKRRTIILSETDTLVSLKLNSIETRRGWCKECSAEVIWLDPRLATELFGMTSFPATGAIHLSQARVCSRSLLNIRNEETLRGERS
jgi:hypothetical protein